MGAMSCPGLASKWILEPASLSQKVTNTPMSFVKARATVTLCSATLFGTLDCCVCTVKLNFYHQVQLRRQHLPAVQDAHHGGAQQHVRVAALVHRAGDARVVHFVETLHGLVAVVLSALQQVVHGHGAAVVVDVVAALAVGEDLDALDEAGGVGRGRGQRVGAVRVPDAEGDLDGLGVDEGRAAGQRDRGCGGEQAQRAGEVLHVMPRRDVAGVACFQLVVQALHQLILGSGGDYLHACLYTRILTRTAKEILPVPTLM